MQATRRSLVVSAIGLATPFIRPAAAARRSVTFAAAGGLFQDVYEPAILEPFGQAHRDISVFYYPAQSSTQVLAVLRQQRDRPEIDVALLDLAAARIATDEGLLEPLPPGSIPVLAELAAPASIPGIAGRAVFSEPLVIVFDAARIAAPASWKSLWSELDERSIGIPGPPDPAGIAFTMVAGRLFSGGNEKRMAADGVTAISELADGVASWDPRPDVYHLVADGAAKLGVGWNMPAQVLSDRMGGRLGVAFPAEGTISRVTTVNLVRRAREPDAARLLIAHLLGAEAQKTTVERMFLGPVNAKARYLESALSRTASTPERARLAMEVDWLAVNAMRDDIVRRWRETIPGSG
jgi:putative spermidine/putrescine transport system substrate-binding protein